MATQVQQRSSATRGGSGEGWWQTAGGRPTEASNNYTAAQVLLRLFDSIRFLVDLAKRRLLWICARPGPAGSGRGL